MVITRYSNQQELKLQQILSRSNHPRTSETYPRRDDAFGFDLHFLLSGGLPVFQKSELQATEKTAWCAAYLQTKSSKMTTWYKYSS